MGVGALVYLQFGVRVFLSQGYDGGSPEPKTKLGSPSPKAGSRICMPPGLANLMGLGFRGCHNGYIYIYIYSK